MAETRINIQRRVSVSDFAKITKRSAKTIRQMCQEGKMPGAIKIANHWSIDLDASKTATYKKVGRPKKN